MNLSEETIGNIVAKDYRSAEVFEQLGIDFCCQGNRTIAIACKDSNLEPEEVISALQKQLSKENFANEQNANFGSWPLDLLCDYIEKKHHRYVRKQIPVINAYLEKIEKVHGNKHPFLSTVSKLFASGGRELQSHMQKEEKVLFPAIRNMIDPQIIIDKKDRSCNFDSIQQPINKMMDEHDAEGNRFRQIRALTQEFTLPSDACETFRLTYLALQDFEKDLHQHIHLENNILFPKAILLEMK